MSTTHLAPRPPRSPTRGELSERLWRHTPPQGYQMLHTTVTQTSRLIFGGAPIRPPVYRTAGCKDGVLPIWGPPPGRAQPSSDSFGSLRVTTHGKHVGQFLLLTKGEHWSGEVAERDDSDIQNGDRQNQRRAETDEQRIGHLKQLTNTSFQ